MDALNRQLAQSPRKANSGEVIVGYVMDETQAKPDLSAIVDTKFKFTFGDLKKQAELEARAAWESGRYSLNDNPFIEGSWSHKWWHDEYSACDA